MANATTKRMSDDSLENVLRHVHNPVDATLAVGSFVTSNIGHKITLAISTTTVSNDTETWTFLDGTTSLMTLVIIYTDGTRAVLLSAERTA